MTCHTVGVPPVIHVSVWQQRSELPSLCLQPRHTWTACARTARQMQKVASAPSRLIKTVLLCNLLVLSAACMRQCTTDGEDGAGGHDALSERLRQQAMEVGDLSRLRELSPSESELADSIGLHTLHVFPLKLDLDDLACRPWATCRGGSRRKCASPTRASSARPAPAPAGASPSATSALPAGVLATVSSTGSLNGTL